MKTVKREASVTVPLCMALLILAALVFALVEGARYYGLKADAEDGTKLAAESLFAGYQPFLLEEYGMFFLDGNFGGDKFRIEGAEDEINAFLYENFIAGKEDAGIDLYHMQQAEAEVTEYMLATDGAGRVFEMQAAKTMKNRLKREAAKKIIEKIQSVKEQADGTESPKEAITGAEEALKEIKAAGEKRAENADTKAAKTESAEAEPAETSGITAQTSENPLEIIKKLKKEGVLALVLPAGKTVSEKTWDVTNCLLKRNCRKGTWEIGGKPGWYERILMQELLKQMAGNAAAPKESGSLSYGTEYIICGKGSDRENLKKTANKLLLLREVVNYLYLQTDEEKKAEALTVASAVGGALASPELITVIRQGILAAWAYAESLCDVKALLAGGKIPLIKNAASWHTQLSNLSETVKADYKGESSGLSYENYLDVLLYERTVKQIAYRGMDLMEYQLKEKADYKSCRMDHMITGIRITAEYHADTLFFEIFGEDTVGGYRFTGKEEYIYGP